MSYNFEDNKSRLLKVPKETKKSFHDKSYEIDIFKWKKMTNSEQSICLMRLRKEIFPVRILTKYKTSLLKKILKIRLKVIRLLENDPSQITLKSFLILNGKLSVMLHITMFIYGLSHKIIHKF